MLELLTKAPFPARNPAQNVADLKAQVAANEKGAAELGKMVRHYGLPMVRAYMRHVQDNAAEAVSASSPSSRPLASRSRPTKAASSRSPSRSTGKRAKRPSISPAPARKSPTRSMRPSRSPALACFTCSARWSTRRFRSTPAAFARSRSSCPKGSMLKPRYPAAGRRRQCGDEPDHRRIASMARSACSARRKAR